MVITRNGYRLRTSSGRGEQEGRVLQATQAALALKTRVLRFRFLGRRVGEDGGDLLHIPSEPWDRRPSPYHFLVSDDKLSLAARIPPKGPNDIQT